MKCFFFSFAILLLYSCENKYEKAEVTALTDSASITGLTGDSVKLVQTAGIRFKVKDVTQGSRDVAAIAKKYGGMIFHQHIESVEVESKELKISSDSLLTITAYNPKAEVTARVPTQNLEVFLQDVGDVGYFIFNSRLDIEDKSLAYLENNLKKGIRAEVLSKPFAKASAPVAKAQTIEVGDDIIDRQIANMTIDGDVQYSLIDLSLYQNAVIQKEVAANQVLSGYTLSFGQRFRNAFADGWAYFLTAVLALTELWMLVVAAVIVYVIYKAWNRRGKSISLQNGL